MRRLHYQGVAVLLPLNEDREELRRRGDRGPLCSYLRQVGRELSFHLPQSDCF